MSDSKEKCFVIMPISDQGDYPAGHFTKVYEQIFKPAIQKAGYEPYRVDENNICDSIIGKIFKAIQECPMALCDLSNRNPNVLYELGIRQAYDKPVVLVQDDKTERIFDVSGINTVQYRSLRLFEDVMDARERITDAIISTKEGKQNSIVKVINAQSAMIASTEMTKEDRIEIMLSGLIKDINELKNENKLKDCSESNELSRYEPISYIRRGNSLESIENDLFVVTFVIKLRQGVTNSQISKEIRHLQNYFNISISFHRDGPNINVTMRGRNSRVFGDALDILKKKIGEEI